MIQHRNFYYISEAERTAAQKSRLDYNIYKPTVRDIEKVMLHSIFDHFFDFNLDQWIKDRYYLMNPYETAELKKNSEYVKEKAVALNR